ncbi:histidine kinase [Planotetraspora phitsanulokensis]|uniref:histidine kinase n=1 Tax=Planotetraspora phitsanulokensis TaxID=575192 RepID=A0A8J3UIL9_9ACTN|nr:histidine kinase [Planotetraspora phitsanulokensis]GII39480.1 two-component sensor histidine kinase [Planotetraspora phitsanulokensis]
MRHIVILNRVPSSLGEFTTSHRRQIVDALLAIAILCFTVPTTLMGLTFSLWGPIPDWIEIIIEVITVGSLLIRRRTALPMIIASVACGVATGQIVPMAFAAYSMTAENKVRHWQLVSIPLIAAATAIDYVDPGTDNFLYLCLVRALTLIYLPALVGTWVRGYRGMILELRAGMRERERQAARMERRKIARELHDTVTHAVTVMVLNAGIIHDSADPKVDRLATTIEDKGIEALGELRDLLRVLRREDEPRTAAAARNIPGLVKEAATTGTQINLDYGLPDVGLPNQVGHACYRVVQEGLSNVRKHALGSRVQVSCQARDGVVTVSVVNSRGGGRAGMSLHRLLPRSGFGLAGLEERITLLSGQLERGPTPDGGFMLRARIPFDLGSARPRGESADEVAGGEKQ